MKKIAIILSGCGNMDGAEIHESVMAMYAVQLNGGEYEVFAPDKEQFHVINHYTKTATDEKRNVLVESARIARGKIQSLDKLDMHNFDGLLLPGGFGAAKNLSDFATSKDDYFVDNQVSDVIRNAHQLQKPIGALCIAPVLLAKLIKGVSITLGNEPNDERKMKLIGANYITVDKADKITIDKTNKVVTGPCYMFDARITEIANAANEVVKAMFEFLK